MFPGNHRPETQAMDTGHDVLTRHRFTRRMLTRAEYHRLGEVGILHDEDRVELLEGQLVQMSPVGPRHAGTIDQLMNIFVEIVGRRAQVRIQNPIVLDDGSEPQPDLVLARLPRAKYRTEHPHPDDILLLVEAADSSRDFDLGAKRELYARAGIGEFWVVDLTTNSVVVCRDPNDGSYRSARTVGTDGQLTVEALPDVTIPVEDLLA